MTPNPQHYNIHQNCIKLTPFFTNTHTSTYFIKLTAVYQSHFVRKVSITFCLQTSPMIRTVYFYGEVLRTKNSGFWNWDRFRRYCVCLRY